MRKLWAGIALVALMVGSAAVGAWAAAGNRQNIEVEYRDIKVSVNDRQVTMDAEPFVYLEKGRTFVPARPLAEALGGTVGWNEATSTVEVFTPTYLKVTNQGEFKLWSMPGQGFTLKTPRAFIKQEMPTAILQVGMADSATGLNAVAVVTRYDLPIPGLTMKQQLDMVFDGVAQLILTDSTITNVVEEGTRITANGSAKIFGQFPASFTMRLIKGQGSTIWMLLSLTPDQLAEHEPTMQAILDSFTLTTK